MAGTLDIQFLQGAILQDGDPISSGWRTLINISFFMGSFQSRGGESSLGAFSRVPVPKRSVRTRFPIGIKFKD